MQWTFLNCLFIFSTHTYDGRKRSPLYLAVKAGAPESVIEILLQQEHFFLKGFDDSLVSGLSGMAVTNRTIQDCIIEKLAERCYFNLLFIDIYANACALSWFLIGSQKLMDGNISFVEPMIIFVCVVIFVLREVIQLKSQPGQYFADPINYCQIASNTLLCLSARHMADEIGNPDPNINKRLLIVSGSFLIAQFTIFLRATFLPFVSYCHILTS